MGDLFVLAPRLVSDGFKDLVVARGLETPASEKRGMPARCQADVPPHVRIQLWPRPYWSGTQSELTMTRLKSRTVAAAALWIASPCLAASQPVMTEQLQQDAMSCVGEAVQICPEVMTADDHGVSCMVGKRASFSPRCRAIYDKVARVLGR